MQVKKFLSVAACSAILSFAFVGQAQATTHINCPGGPGGIPPHIDTDMSNVGAAATAAAYAAAGINCERTRCSLERFDPDVVSKGDPFYVKNFDPGKCSAPKDPVEPATDYPARK